MFQKRVTHWIILAFTLVLFLLEGCAEPYSIQIMSLDDGKIITLKREFSHRLCLFTAGNDNNSFWIITANSDNEIFIIKYNMQGGVEKKIKLPFFFDSWLQREERILIPAIDILLYANNNKIFNIIWGRKKKYCSKNFLLINTRTCITLMINILLPKQFPERPQKEISILISISLIFKLVLPLQNYRKIRLLISWIVSSIVKRPKLQYT